MARRDRRDGRTHGGVCVYILASLEHIVTPLLISENAERIWLVLHSDLGPLNLCCWYRPPAHGETASIRTLWEEWNDVGGSSVGTIITGDINVHHIRWLSFSCHNSVEGTALYAG